MDCILFADIKFGPVKDPPDTDPTVNVFAIMLFVDNKFRPVNDPPDADPTNNVFAIMLPAVILPAVT